MRLEKWLREIIPVLNFSNDREIGYIFSLDRKLEFVLIGDRNKLPKVNEEYLRDKIVIHNHLHKYELSFDDIGFALYLNSIVISVKENKAMIFNPKKLTNEKRTWLNYLIFMMCNGLSVYEWYNTLNLIRKVFCKTINLK